MAAQRSVGEGASFTVRIRTYDADNVLSTPVSVKYRIDCATTSTVIRDWTQISASADQVLRITSSDTRIVNDANRRELRNLTVVIDDDLSTQFVPALPYDFYVNNVAPGQRVTT